MRRPSMRAVGALLLGVGLACLGWVGYEYVGSNLVAERHYDQELQSVRKGWELPSPPASPRAKAESEAKEDDPREDPGSALAVLRIPAFGDSYEVPVLAGIDDKALNRGVGHYPGSAAPGQLGNFALAGHRVTHGEPFRRLLQLNRGDEVVVETRDTTYTYVLEAAPRDLTVQSDASWVVDPVPGRAGAKPTQALLTLTTCQDLFRSSDRSVGFGRLVATKQN